MIPAVRSIMHISPELSAAEECWRQSKGELLHVSHVTMGNLRDAITDFENKTFDLDIYTGMSKFVMPFTLALCVDAITYFFIPVYKYLMRSL